MFPAIIKPRCLGIRMIVYTFEDNLDVVNKSKISAILFMYYNVFCKQKNANKTMTRA